MPPGPPLGTLPEPALLCRSTASRSAVLTRGGICVPPTVTYLPYRVSGSTLTAVRRSQLLARWPGTHSRILFGIQRAAQTVLGICLKRTCSRVTSASSALGVLNDYALYKSTHSLTHSLSVDGMASYSDTASHVEGCRYRCSEQRHGVVVRRLTPLQRRIRCVVSWTTASAETRRVHRALGCRGRSVQCNVPLPCHHCRCVGVPGAVSR